MTIEIHEPELEALIQQRMETGRFGSVEEVLIEALQSSREIVPTQSAERNHPAEVFPESSFEGVNADFPLETADPDVIRSKNFVELFEPIRGLFEDGELDFSRKPDYMRPVDFS